MYAKLINNNLILAPNKKDNIFNYNSEYNRDMLLEDGYKKLIKADKEEDKFYSISYIETENEIHEVLEDITSHVKKQEKIEDIEKRIAELKLLFANNLIQQEFSNIEIYQNIIKGLEETKQSLEESN